MRLILPVRLVADGVPAVGGVAPELTQAPVTQRDRQERGGHRG